MWFRSAAPSLACRKYFLQPICSGLNTKIDSASECKPYLYILGGDAASGYFETMPVHLLLDTLPKDPTEIILPEHLTSNGKVNYTLGDTVTLGTDVHNQSKIHIEIRLKTHIFPRTFAS